MKKKAYEKPSFRVVELQHKCQILSDSEDPKRNVPWWDGEGGSRRTNDFDDEE
ncbi:MAG: hypothetical protein J6Z14_12040 [Prevotella sp.]|nr:hypothetical protein [Prevotella sp.]